METDRNKAAKSGSSPASCSASLRVPRKRPATWAPGDIAVEYITLRRDDDPEPPCILLMVTRIEGEMVHCESLDQYRPMTIKANQLMGVAEAVDSFERLADEMTVKSYRLGKQKLEALATPFAPWPEWIRTLGFWEERPEDRPDGWDVIRQFIPLNVRVVAPPPLESGGIEIEKLKGGCPPTTCCASSFLDDGYGVSSGPQIKEDLRGMLSSSDDVERVLSYCIRLRNQAIRTSLNDGDGCRAVEPLEEPEGIIPTQTPILDANPD